MAYPFGFGLTYTPGTQTRSKESMHGTASSPGPLSTSLGRCARLSLREQSRDCLWPRAEFPQVPLKTEIGEGVTRGVPWYGSVFPFMGKEKLNRPGPLVPPWAPLLFARRISHGLRNDPHEAACGMCLARVLGKPVMTALCFKSITLISQNTAR